MQEYLEKYEQWRRIAADKTVTDSLAEMENNSDEIMNAFYKDLEFGTGGLRGIMSAGTNRMNVYTVRKTTAGLAKYMLAKGKKRCAVSFDSRINSKLFAETAAATLAENGIEVFITEECMPTPFVSYLVRYYHCDAGVNITASHNPSCYNGYKVYDENGCQLTDSSANEVLSYIESSELFGSFADFSRYLGGLIRYVDRSAEDSYIACVLGESLGSADGLKVTYTPLNGAGYRLVPKVLSVIGVNDLTVVPEQGYPDGSFQTCPYPNPEKSEALTLAVRLAEREKSDVVIATDPDSDRLGVAVRHQGKFIQLGGNEVGVLLCDYILSTLERSGRLPENPVVVKTIVTTTMIDALAKKYNVEVRNVLTGFKYIGDVINKLEVQGEQSRFVFGFEESCGYLKGSYVRDKDGVVASMLFAECAAYCKARGQTVIDRLEQLYKEFGRYYQQTTGYRFDGASGDSRKNKLLEDLRIEPITKLGDSDVVDVCDFLTQTKFDLPRANVLSIGSADGSRLIIRPSGTEPLIKCYAIVRDDKNRLEAIKKQTDSLFLQQ